MQLQLDQMSMSMTTGGSPSLRHRSSSGRSASIISPFSSTGGHRSSWRRDSSGMEKECNISLDVEGGGGAGGGGREEDEEEKASPVIKARLNNLREENEILKHRVMEVEENLKKALENTKTYQKVRNINIRLYTSTLLCCPLCVRDFYDTINYTYISCPCTG